ncbi:MAG: SDR family NAD(P)-dependent oxidoreductase, partial [Burkholderiales bacterium]|nr:SDR family NAD(P)-dependent oxidoreductase [Anaerolineae bacterium]
MPMLDGQVALITGAAGDLGNAMAVRLAREGAAVVMLDVLSESKAAEQITRVNESALVPARYLQVDVRERAAVDDAIANLERLDIVCSNAGVVEPSSFLDVTLECWQY